MIYLFDFLRELTFPYCDIFTLCPMVTAFILSMYKSRTLDINVCFNLELNLRINGLPISPVLFLSKILAK